MLKVELLRFFKASALLTVGAIFLLLGTATVAAGGFILLMEVMHPGLALTLVGAALLVIAAIVAGMAQAFGRDRTLDDDEPETYRHG